MSKYGTTQTDFGWSNIVHTLQCPACDFQTLRPEALKEHCTRSHRTLHRLVVFSCPLCHARSTDVRLIDEHKRLYHTTDSVQAFASSTEISTQAVARNARPLETQKARRRSLPQAEPQAASSRNLGESRVKRDSSGHATSETPEDCSVLRRTVRKSSIRAIAAMASPNLAPKEGESSASEEISPVLQGGRRRRSSDASGAAEGSAEKPSGSGMQGKPRREDRLHPAVRAHMDTLFLRGVRRPDEMMAQLRRFVKAEFVGGPEQLQPSMWTVRRLLKAMAEVEEVSSVHPKRLRVNLTSPPPAERAHSSPIKSSSSSGEQRPRKIFTSSDAPDRLPVVKLEENNVELVRCLKCGVRVPFHSDGTRAAQDAALMAHLANSHGIRKREPIVYPAARQRSQSAQDHVTDLDAETEEVKAEVRILKESGVLPAAVTSAVQVKLERDEELRLTGARILPSSSSSVATNRKHRSPKLPPADEQEEEEVALMAVRFKEPTVKEPLSERLQIDLDSLNASSASTVEPLKTGESLELLAEFSDLDKEKAETSDEKEEAKEGEGERIETSTDESNRWAPEAMDLEEVGGSKTQEDDVERNDAESRQSDVVIEKDTAHEKMDLDVKENDVDPEENDSEVKENCQTGIEVKENDLESIQADLEIKENDLEADQVSIEVKENGLENDQVSIEDKKNGLENDQVSIEVKENGLENDQVSIEDKENGIEMDQVSIEVKENGIEAVQETFEIKENDEMSTQENTDFIVEENHTEKTQQENDHGSRSSNDDLGDDENAAREPEQSAVAEESEGVERIEVVREANQKRTQPEEWQCSHCFAGFEDEKELKSHVEDIHSL